MNSNVLALLQRRAAEAEIRLETRNDVRPDEFLFLPGLDDWLRAMPNSIARSSLFAPIARGKPIHHEQVVLVSRSDAVITYTGYQLDEAKADAWMQLMYEARCVPLGRPVTINRAAFLRAIGRQGCGRDYTWLKGTMLAFMTATITIEVKKSDGSRKYQIGGGMRAFHMLESFEYDAESESYSFIIDPRWKGAFGGNEYALIDWKKRRHIAQNHDMAKALQRLVATSSDQVQRFALDWLKEKLRYGSPMRKFRSALKNAMEELDRVEVITCGRIELSTRGKLQVVWTKLGKTRN